MREVSRNVHKVQVLLADELNLGCLEETVVVLTDKASVFNGLKRDLPHVGLGADDPDIVGMANVGLFREGDVLADEHADTNARHVEAIEEGLNGGVNLQTLAFPFPFQDALSHGGHHAVMSPFDLLQGLGEAFVVVVQFRGPVSSIVGRNKIPPHRHTLPIGVMVHRRAGGGTVLTLFHAGVLGGLGENTGRTPIGSVRSHQASFNFLGERGSREGDDFLCALVRTPQFGRGGRIEGESNLERLRIPVLHLFDGGHFTQPIRKLAQILNAMGQSDGKLFGQELRGTEESA